jgi:iron complex transport system substrate-binding protein
LTRALAAASLILAVASGGGAAQPAAGRPVVPPRIIALSPHATELVFAAGGGDRLVGAVAYSDHPPQARNLPRIGDATRLDRERILALEPGIAVAWSTGNRETDLQWLSSLGVEVYRSDPRRVDQVADDLEAIGERAGTGPAARKAAERFRRRLAELHRRYAALKPLPAFYALWDRPLMTVGGDTLISRVMALCGLRNVFEQVRTDNLSLSTESLVALGPRVVVVPEAGSGADPAPIWRSPAWPGARPAEIRIDADLLQRPGPRLLDGAERLCEARARLGQSREPPVRDQRQ